MDNPGTVILKLANKYKADMVKLRRELHQYPETALKEFRTQKTIAAMLKKVGCKVNTKIWKTAVAGTLEGKGKGKTAGIRADMDALPVTEQTGYSFVSKIPGKMHACGHDNHMAIVWGAAKILSELKDELNGSVKFIYQPSEESPPGGAKFLIEKGVLKNPDVDVMFGLHVDPTIPVGKIGLYDGAMMAQPDNFTIEITGRSGHAARPHETVDAIMVAANVITALQNISSRQVDPVSPVVVTIGTITGGKAENIIADSVRMSGTARAIEKGLTKAIPGMIEKIVRGVCGTYGAKYKIDYFQGYPPLNNARSVNDIYRFTAGELFGRRSIIELPDPVLGGEDFSYYAEEVPSAMCRLGIMNKKMGADKPWHHPAFKVDEKAIEIGAALLSYSVWKALMD